MRSLHGETLQQVILAHPDTTSVFLPSSHDSKTRTTICSGGYQLHCHMTSIDKTRRGGNRGIGAHRQRRRVQEKEGIQCGREQKIYTEGESNPPRVLDSVGNRLEGAHVTDTPSVFHMFGGFLLWDIKLINTGASTST